MLDPPDVNSEQFLGILESINEFKTVTDGFTRLVNDPGYTMDYFILTTTLIEAGEGDSRVLSGIPLPNFLFIQSCARLLNLMSFKNSIDGFHEEAFEKAEVIVRSSRTQKFSFLISHLIGIALLRIGTDAWFEAVERCDDPVLLRQTLTRMNEVSPKQPFITTDYDIMTIDLVGAIRNLSRYGIKADLQNKTGQEIQSQLFALQAEFYRNVVIPQYNDVQILERYRRISEGLEVTSAMLGGKVKSLKALPGYLSSPFMKAKIFVSSYPNNLEACTRDNASRASFDLLTIHTAMKIYRLEHGEAPSSLESLVPDYLTHIPGDFFCPDDSPYRHAQSLYSVGPDKQDQKAQLMYDPTNGTISPGDIMLISRYK